jgi:uncharacterized protein (DUF362 family)
MNASASPSNDATSRSYRITRRALLRTAMAALLVPGVAPAWRAKASAPPYAVGVGLSRAPYAATLRAVLASTGWNAAAISGKRVVLKPNLVVAASPSSGTITDPKVVRALVDLALASGAVEVIIIEGGPSGAVFDQTGYSFFNSYDPQGRVRLLDLAGAPVRSAATTTNLAYGRILLPELLFEPDVFFVSVAKMKVHSLAYATLAMKNYYGLPPIDPYMIPERSGRFGMHERSLNQTAVDLYAARPADFAVIDATWAMEGRGPVGGDPVRLDTVIAGRNTLAVDLVGLAAMEISIERVGHLQLAAGLGLGPASLAEVEVRGDALQTYPFSMPPTLPLVGLPRCSPAPFQPAAGPASITAFVNQPCLLRAEIVRPSNVTAELPVVALLSEWQPHPGGAISFSWDGTFDDGRTVPPATYACRIAARHPHRATVLHSFGWVPVVV